MKNGTFRGLSMTFFVLMLIPVASAQAQASRPSQGAGFGVTLERGDEITATGFTDEFGVYAAYAINPSLHVGTQLQFKIASIEGIGYNYIVLSPYVKYLLTPRGRISPLFSGALEVQSVDGDSSFGLSIGGGAEYFPTRDFGVAVQLKVLSFKFGDFSETSFGLFGPSLSAEWFF